MTNDQTIINEITNALDSLRRAVHTLHVEADMHYAVSNNHRGNIRNDATYGLDVIIHDLENKISFLSKALDK